MEGNNEKGIVNFSLLLTVLLFTASALAADKVVVVPLNTCSNGLTQCPGECIDTNIDSIVKENRRPRQCHIEI